MQDMFGRVFSRKQPSQRNNPSSSSSNPLVGRRITNFKYVYTVKKKLDKDGFTTVKDRKGEKLLCKTFDRDKTPEDIRREVEIVYHLDGHPYIAQLVDIVNDGTSVYIIMKRVRGDDLAKMMIKRSSLLGWPTKKPKPLREDEAKIVFRQIAEFIHYCHGMNVMYRDIKPENIMFMNKKKGDIRPESHLFVNRKRDMTIRIMDFSKCTFFQPGEQFQEQVGTLPYIAPEVATNGQAYGPKADVWSAGVIFYYLLTGELPFSAESMNDLPRAIRESRYKNYGANPAWQNISGGAKRLVSSMLEENVEERFSAAQIIGHPWLKLAEDQVDPWFGPQKDITIIGRMKKFGEMSKFKRLAILVIVKSLPDEQTSGLRNMYELMKNPEYVSNPGQRYKGKEVAESLTFHQMKVALANWGIDDPHMDQLLKAMDVDGNEVIDHSEFIAATIHGDRYCKDEFLREAFRVYDIYDRGYMTEENLRPVLQKYKLPERMQNEIIDEVLTSKGNIHLPFEMFASHMKIQN